MLCAAMTLSHTTHITTIHPRKHSIHCLVLLALLELLHDGELDPLALGEADHGLVALADHEDVRAAT